MNVAFNFKSINSDSDDYFPMVEAMHAASEKSIVGYHVKKRDGTQKLYYGRIFLDASESLSGIALNAEALVGLDIICQVVTGGRQIGTSISVGRPSFYRPEEACLFEFFDFGVATISSSTDEEKDINLRMVFVGTQPNSVARNEEQQQNLIRSQMGSPLFQELLRQALRDGQNRESWLRVLNQMELPEPTQSESLSFLQ